jgi:hypothetical protein
MALQGSAACFFPGDTIIVRTTTALIFERESDWSPCPLFDIGTTALVLYVNPHTTGSGRRWHMILYACKHKTGIGWLPGIGEWKKL